MGYNTVVKIINDGFECLERDPATFVRNIRELMNGGGEAGLGNHGNVMQVAHAQHADTFALYGVYGNLMVSLNPWNRETNDLIDRRPDIVKNYINQARSQLNALEFRLNERL